MSTTNRDWTAAKFERYQKEGRGQGTGKEMDALVEMLDSLET